MNLLPRFRVKSFHLNEMLGKTIEFKSVCGVAKSAGILIYENNFRERKKAIKNSFEG